MNNVEKLQKLIAYISESDGEIDNFEQIKTYLASIANSLAVIADKLTEESEEEE